MLPSFSSPTVSTPLAHIRTHPPHVYGLPTGRDQQATTAKYADGVPDLRRTDGTDAGLLFPDRPLCHQSVVLVRRHLEAHGIATVASHQMPPPEQHERPTDRAPALPTAHDLSERRNHLVGEQLEMRLRPACRKITHDVRNGSGLAGVPTDLEAREEDEIEAQPTVELPLKSRPLQVQLSGRFARDGFL